MSCWGPLAPLLTMLTMLTTAMAKTKINTQLKITNRQQFVLTQVILCFLYFLQIVSYIINIFLYYITRSTFTGNQTPTPPVFVAPTGQNGCPSPAADFQHFQQINKNTLPLFSNLNEKIRRVEIFRIYF